LFDRIDMHTTVPRVDTKSSVVTESRNALNAFASLCKLYARDSASDFQRMANLTVYVMRIRAWRRFDITASYKPRGIV
jgi:hypothetical protein